MGIGIAATGCADVMSGVFTDLTLRLFFQALRVLQAVIGQERPLVTAFESGQPTAPGYAVAVSACLTIVALLHYSFLTSSAKEYVEVLESQFINQTSLSVEQAQVLKRVLIRLRGGEAYLANLHSRLWWLSVLGFGFLSLFSSITAVVAWKANKLLQQTGPNGPSADLAR